MVCYRGLHNAAINSPAIMSSSGKRRKLKEREEAPGPGMKFESFVALRNEEYEVQTPVLSGA